MLLILVAATGNNRTSEVEPISIQKRFHINFWNSKTQSRAIVNYESVLDQLLTYQVDQIKIIEPDEIEDLVIVEGKDYCTLFTCTPGGSNRVTARCKRITN